MEEIKCELNKCPYYRYACERLINNGRVEISCTAITDNKTQVYNLNYWGHTYPPDWCPRLKGDKIYE